MTHTTRTLYQSPLVCLQHFQCDGRHSHAKGEECTEGHELVFVKRGAWVRHDSSGRRLADPAQLFFFNAGAPYEIEHPLGGDECTIVSFPTEQILKTACELGLSPDDPKRPFQFAAIPLTGAMQWLHRRLLASGAPLERDELALQILGQALTGSAGHPRRMLRKSDANRRELAHAATLALARTYRQPVTLESLARELGCSQFHLARVFHAWMGRSIHQHLIELRMAAALEDLFDTQRPLADIAQDLGFCDHAHFTATFTKRFGRTPSAVRGAVAADAREP